MALVLDGSKYPVPERGVKGILSVNMHSHAVGVKGYARAEVVAQILAPS
jgi:hypothetical protein